jgi:hypothetical protein
MKINLYFKVWSLVRLYSKKLELKVELTESN